MTLASGPLEDVDRQPSREELQVWAFNYFAGLSCFRHFRTPIQYADCSFELVASGHLDTHGEYSDFDVLHRFSRQGLTIRVWHKDAVGSIL